MMNDECGMMNDKQMLSVHRSLFFILICFLCASPVSVVKFSSATHNLSKEFYCATQRERCP